MTATFNFDLDNPDDMQSMNDMLKATDYKIVLHQIDQYLRNRIKHDNFDSEGALKALEDTRVQLWEAIREFNIEL